MCKTNVKHTQAVFALPSTSTSEIDILCCPSHISIDKQFPGFGPQKIVLGLSTFDSCTPSCKYIVFYAIENQLQRIRNRQSGRFIHVEPNARNVFVCSRFFRLTPVTTHSLRNTSIFIWTEVLFIPAALSRARGYGKRKQYCKRQSFNAPIEFDVNSELVRCHSTRNRSQLINVRIIAEWVCQRANI